MTNLMLIVCIFRDKHIVDHGIVGRCHDVAGTVQVGDLAGRGNASGRFEQHFHVRVQFHECAGCFLHRDRKAPGMKDDQVAGEFFRLCLRNCPEPSCKPAINSAGRNNLRIVFMVMGLIVYSDLFQFVHQVPESLFDACIGGVVEGIEGIHQLLPFRSQACASFFASAAMFLQ